MRENFQKFTKVERKVNTSFDRESLKNPLAPPAAQKKKSARLPIIAYDWKQFIH